jgi:hypothetical protein
MVPAALSADEARDGEWVCLECEELDEPVFRERRESG